MRSPSTPQPIEEDPMPSPRLRFDEVEEAKLEERRRLRRTRGKRSTMLTGGSGLTGTAPTTHKMLFGE